MAIVSDSACRPLQAVILAGGPGTRLGSLTDSIPKPLLPIAGRPFLSYLLQELSRFEFRNIVLLAGYRAHRVEEFLDANDFSELEILCVTEPEPAGTAGALAHAAAYLDNNFLLLNGDSFFDINLLDLVDEGNGLGSQLGRLALRRMTDVTRSGTVCLSGERITRFADRPDERGPALINGGIYWLSRNILDFVPAPPCSLEREVFPRLADSGRLDGRSYEGFFIDIGVVEDLKRGELMIPECFNRPAAFLKRSLIAEPHFDDGQRIDPIRWIPGAIDAVRRINDNGCYVIIFSGSRFVDHKRGPADRSGPDVEEWMNGQLRRSGAHIDRYLEFPPGLGPASANRELTGPVPGSTPDSAFGVIDDWRVNMGDSILIGDEDDDLAFARTLGVDGRLCGGGNLESVVRNLFPRSG